jgi:lipoprotein-releasing system permease protein
VFSRFVAIRYLRGAEGRVEGRRFLRLVTGVAVGGVAVGTAALLLALTIVRGFSREIQEKVVGFGQHVQVESYLGGPLDGADTLATRLAGFEGVQTVTPAVIEFALLRAPTPAAGAPAIAGALLYGTPVHGQPFVARHVDAGRFDFTPDENGRPGLVLGASMAGDLGLEPGSTITVFSTRQLTGSGDLGTLGARPRVRQFHVAGVYETGLADFDERFVFGDIEDARRLFGYDSNQVSRFELTIDDLNQSPVLAAQISEQVGPPVFARSVFDVFRNLFAWVRLQEGIVPLVISVLVFVAAFNIVGTLLMVILDKTREIGVMVAMGASRSSVRRVFLTYGVLVGVLGSVIGAALAFAVAGLQARFGIIPLPQEAYYLDTAPVELRAVDFLIVPAVAVVLCAAMAWLPARVAARVEPIRAIRFGA